MPNRTIYIDGVGEAILYKFKSARSIKIRISGSVIKVTMPSWMPYSVAQSFINKRTSWIKENIKTPTKLANNQRFGKNIILKTEVSESTRFSSKLTDNTLTVRVPGHLALDSKEVQNKLSYYVMNALQVEAERLIIPLVREKARLENFQVKSICVKKLKSRWGSCTNRNELTFNAYLIQLPWELINYVIYHELSHTIHMNHSKKFWDVLMQKVPDSDILRKQLKAYSPHIILQT